MKRLKGAMWSFFFANKQSFCLHSALNHLVKCETIGRNVHRVCHMLVRVHSWAHAGEQPKQRHSENNRSVALIVVKSSTDTFKTNNDLILLSYF